MNKDIIDCITSIQEQTGLDIDMFTTKGERVASTYEAKPCYDYDVSLDKLMSSQGFVFDKRQNITYFLISLGGENYIGVIMGANEVSKNYAYMVSKLLEKAHKTEEVKIKPQEILYELIEGNKELTSAQRQGLAHFKNYLYHVLILEAPSSSCREITNYLFEILQEPDYVIPIKSTRIAILKRSEDGGDYQSANEFAFMLMQGIEQDLSKTIYIGIGGVAKGYREVPQAYAYAQAALRIGKLIDPKNKVYSYKDYLLIKLYEDMPKEAIRQYLDMNLDEKAKEVLNDRELMETAEQFFANSLNISETARVMFMHRNTLIYRLDKIESITGLNIRRFADAMIFRTLNILYKMTKGA